MEKIKRMSGIEEMICSHGIGHPTYDSAKKVAEKYGHDIGTWLTHGCDGCCNRIPECQEVKDESDA